MIELSDEAFERLVQKGIDAIPPEFVDKLENVAIVVADAPTVEQIQKLRLRHRLGLFGLYEGVPKPKRWGYGQVLPDKITIFKKPMEYLAQTEADIEEMVKNTVWHEIAHHFGMDENEVRAAERRRRESMKQVQES